MIYDKPTLEPQLIKHVVNLGLLDRHEISRAKSLADRESISISRAILKLGLLEEEGLLPEVAKIAQLPFVSQVDKYSLDVERFGDLTAQYCSSNGVSPIIDEHGVRLIAVSDPLNTGILTELEYHVDQDFSVVVATNRTVRTLLALAEAVEDPDELSVDLLATDQDNSRRDGIDGPVIRFVAQVLEDAVAINASDIHLEAQEDGLRIRLRVGGLLQVYPVDAALSGRSILARVKVMASMNVAEKRLPQDGRINSNIAGRKVDFRISSVPTSFGESIVCRVLDPRSLHLGWDKLGFDTKTAQDVIDIVEQPSGLFLVTGPTGSGKTTTLYTALAHLNRMDRKILTVEDPIEYNLAGVEQVQVHEEIGMTFARALRSFLRQDPNVIMIGEIRDEETAEIACRAALVGRMVLSTLHTNSPEGAKIRLVDLGVPEYIVNDVLRGVLGQRLDVAGGERRLAYSLKK